jgi:hypothetical protein
MAENVIAGTQELFHQSSVRSQALPGGDGEEHMRTGMDVCGPDQLKVLQQIFDSVWLQMKQDSNFQLAEEEELRREVSQRVIAFAGQDLFDLNGIKSRVLKSMERHRA